MSARIRWIIFLLILVLAIGWLWALQARRTALFEQALSNSPQIRTRAAEALLEEDIVPSALPMQLIEIRVGISRPLAEVGGKKAISALVSLLSDTEDSPRNAAGEALITIGAPALPALSQVLLMGDTNAQKKAAEVFGRIGLPALPYLRRLLEDSTSQAYACSALGAIGDTSNPQVAEEALVPLLRAVSCQDTTLANAAIPVLGEHRFIKAVAPLELAVAKDALRANAIFALGEIGDSRATPILLPYINDKNLRIQTVQALGQIGDVRAAAPLAATLNDPNQDYRSVLVLAFQRIGAPAAGVLSSYLHAPEVEVRRTAVLAMRGEAVPEAMPSLQIALSDSDSQVRAAAARAMGWPGNTASIPALLSALHDKEGIVVDAAIGALANIGPASVPSLLPLFSSTDKTFALYGSRAFVQMGSAAIPSLLNALDTSSGLSKIWVVVTLGDLKAKQAIPKLQQVRQVSQGDLLWATKQALQKLGVDISTTKISKN